MTPLATETDRTYRVLPSAGIVRANFNFTFLASTSSSVSGLLFEIPSDQAYFWTPRWQAGEADADADLATGRYREFDDVDDLIGWLNSDDD